MLGKRKSVEAAIAKTRHGAQGPRLRRVLGVRDLVFLGVGAVVGAGIFSSVGELAAGSGSHPGAGPAVAVSFVLCAIACGFAALCYAELAALVPVAGSAYTYAYVTLGELWAWIIGWDLIIEYAIGNIYVAQSWTEYLRSLLRGTFNLDIPAWMATDLQTAAADPAIAATAPRVGSFVVAFNLPAAVITALLTLVLVRGVRESARFNTVLVMGKLALIGLFVGVGAFFVQPANFVPFAPQGFSGIWSGASLAFFSYIGFDALTTTAEEVRNPQRDLPRGMILCLALCTAVYVLTALVMTGMVPSAELGTADPLAHALRVAGLAGLSNVMAAGAVIAVTAVLLVFQMGQPRILLAMARDGLLPAAFARIHPRHETPAFGTIATGVFVALAPTFITPAQALELTSIGTLFAFILVSVGVIALRIAEPARVRPFRCPGYPWVPLASIAACMGLMLGLPPMNWLRFLVWLAAGLAIYLGYGRRRSRLAIEDRAM
jgi:APA family basic amino acid/polyamine antiporter